MFRRKVKPLSEILGKLLREEGLEAPLLQKRIVSAWDIVAGPTVVRYTQEKSIRNQTLFVKIINPASGPFHDAHTAGKAFERPCGVVCYFRYPYLLASFPHIKLFFYSYQMGTRSLQALFSDGMGMIFYYSKRGAFLIVQLNAFMGNVHRMPSSGASSHTDDSVSCVVCKYLIYDNL